MKWNDPENLDRIEKAVRAVEAGTSAEFVVVIAPQSGSYLDREILFGTGAGFAAMAFLVLSPWNFHPVLALADFLVVSGAAALACNWLPGLKGLVVGRRRREKNLRQSMFVAFHDEGADATRDRTGVLVYASVFERAIRIHADLGIEGKIGEAVWNDIVREAGSPGPEAMSEALVKAVEAAGRALAGKFPPAGENPDEIPNRPRLRP